MILWNDELFKAEIVRVSDILHDDGKFLPYARFCNKCLQWLFLCNFTGSAKCTVAQIKRTDTYFFRVKNLSLLLQVYYVLRTSNTSELIEYKTHWEFELHKPFSAKKDFINMLQRIIKSSKMFDFQFCFLLHIFVPTVQLKWWKNAMMFYVHFAILALLHIFVPSLLYS